ncbi:glycoside hydrolase family 27 protein [Microbacterium oleivorans]|uniref:glycoside hydrolase family 27 protein n=1 Tax=Microbacterium oleivorans TaxID=273677 RepID=UPI00203BA105|nr:glycoside hydrolase family 27 protein [Microbacterium oleivorans]MCM3696742.1 glycoside hydrolase family 27 protein [Microbacterium oleivorans]
MVLARPNRPPMGWNSWDCYGTTVTEAEVLANARFMAEHLRDAGWDTIVVDADWADPDARSHGYNDDARLHLDGAGRLQPDPGRFPSSAGGLGFRPLAEQVHALGLNFGLHVMRGIPRRAIAHGLLVHGTETPLADLADPANDCEWNPHFVGIDHDHPDAAGYYRSTVALYDQWGVDLIKADDMLWPYQERDIAAYSDAVAAADRQIVLSLSPGRDLSAAHLDHLTGHASMWRICDDVWDRWEDVADNLGRMARWAPHAGRGAWPDADMLPLGRIGIRAERGEPREDALSPDERRSLLTLWVIARSPLMFGGDLPTTDPGTIAMLRNPGILDLLTRADSSGEIRREHGLVLWRAVGGGTTWIAGVNTTEAPLTATLDSRDLGFGRTAHAVIDVWTGASVPTRPARAGDSTVRGVAPDSRAFNVALPPHGCVFWRFDG